MTRSQCLGRLARCVFCALASVASRGIGAANENTPSTALLRAALTFHAAFDRTADADFARGDPRIHTAAERARRDTAATGLPTDDLVRLAPGEGRFGGALEFRKKI